MPIRGCAIAARMRLLLPSVSERRALAARMALTTLAAKNAECARSGIMPVTLAWRTAPIASAISESAPLPDPAAPLLPPRSGGRLG